MADRLHSALRTETVRTEHSRGFVLTLVRLQHGKDSVTHSLHVVPNLWSTYGMQGSDVLAIAGLLRSSCTFTSGECFVREVPADFDVAAFGAALAGALEKLKSAQQHLEHCGLVLEQPEGWGYFHHRPATPVRQPRSFQRGDGHTAAKVERMKSVEDDVFSYVLSWIDDGGNPKGWTIHYRAKHPPLTAELGAAMAFVGDFRSFRECPEFDFESCEWRHISFAPGQTPFDSNAGSVHQEFNNHPTHLAPGLHDLLDAHRILEPHGSSFLRISPPIPASAAPIMPSTPRPASRNTSRPSSVGFPNAFDVAISFAGTERAAAEQLAQRLREHGVTVFYDNFYPEHLWGKDLVVLFDGIYRKQSKYCVMFVSKSYVERMWTNHERRSAQARALEEKGAEYILPIRVDDSEVPGLPPTIGYASLADLGIATIAEMLVRKLRG